MDEEGGEWMRRGGGWMKVVRNDEVWNFLAHLSRGGFV